MMTVQVNGDAREVAQDATIDALLVALEIQGKRIAVAVNGHVIPKASHGEKTLAAGDKVEIVRMVGGG